MKHRRKRKLHRSFLNYETASSGLAYVQFMSQKEEFTEKNIEEIIPNNF